MTPRVDASVPVVALGGHHGVLGIARSLGRLGIPVLAVHGDPRAPALSSRYLRRVVEWSFARHSAEESVDRLLALAEEVGGRPVLIPTTDDLALLVAEHGDALAAAYRFPHVPPKLVRALSDKRELFFLARRLGIPTPETVFPLRRAEVEAFAREAVFPVMLKGIDGQRLFRRTGRKMEIVADAERLLRAYDEMEDPAAPNLMLQEYVPGGDDTIWMFNGYFDE
ncbi:MAG TPA: hypothetical protein VFQ39_13310, partial [Longimicrobium sp.]|nr:hypothetical protein [Longimicrobium sp.]